MTLTTVNPALLDTQAQYTGFKNRIINGAMVIDQRNAGALVAGATGNIYAVDRTSIFVGGSGTGRISGQRSTTAPTGFVNSLISTVTTADASPAAAYGYANLQRIEGYNVADLGWGAAGAATITISFWVRSSLTGTYAVSLLNEANDRTYVSTYSISAANTFEQKTITIAGDVSGTWDKTNLTGIAVFFGLGGGSSRTTSTFNTWMAPTVASTAITTASGCVNWIGTSGATFYITGVQLEKGSTATSFDYRPYGTELALCQRYFEKNFPADVAPQNSYTANGFSGGGNGWVSWGTTNIRGPLFGFRVSKRAAPTMTYFNGNSPTSGTLGVYDPASGWKATTVLTSYPTTEEWRTDSTTSGWTPTTGNVYLFSGWWTASSEL